MKSAVPWSVKGVEPDAREAAKRAARSAGMTLGAWLNQKLLESDAANFGATPAYDADLAREIGARPTARPEPSYAQERYDTPAPASPDPTAEMGAVNHTLDALQRHLKDADSRSERTFGQISHALEAVLDKLDQAGERRRSNLSADATDSLLAIKSALGDMTQRLTAVENRHAPSHDMAGIERSVTEIGRAFETATMRTSQRIDTMEQVEARRMDAVRGLEGAVTELAHRLENNSKDHAITLRETQRDVDELHRSFAARKSDDGIGETRLAASLEILQTRISDLAAQVENSRKSLNKSVTDKDLSKLERRLTDATAVALEHVASKAVTQQDLASIELRIQEAGDRAVTPQDLATLEGRMAGAAKSSMQDAVRSLQSGLREELLERLDAAEARSAEAVQKLQVEAEQNRLAAAPKEPDLADLESALGVRLQEIATRLDGMSTEFDARLNDHGTSTRNDLGALRNELLGQAYPPQTQQQARQEAAPVPQQARRGTAPQPQVPQQQVPQQQARQAQPQQAPPPPGGGGNPQDPNDYMASARAAVRDNQGKPFVPERPSGASRKQPTRKRFVWFFLVVATISITAIAYSIWDRYQLEQDLNAADVFDPNAQGPQSGVDPVPAEAAPGNGEATSTEPDVQIAAQQAADADQPTETLQSRTPSRTPTREEITPTPEPAAQTQEPAPQPIVQERTPANQPPAPVTTAPVRAQPSAIDIYASAVELLERPSGTNDRSAAQQLRRAADQGLTIAQYRLATLYETGRGVEQDENLSRAWYTQAAEGGNVRAMHNLAVIYAEGAAGDEPDFTESARWFAEAASYGVRDSQFNLAVLFERGLGVRADASQAYLWYSIAEAGGDPEAGSRRTALSQRMEDSARRQIDAAVGDWGPRPVDALANGRISLSRTTGANGATVAQVARVQELLSALGYAPGPPDGLMGPRTAETIRQFELSVGMTITGRVTPALLSRLEAELSARASDR